MRYFGNRHQKTSSSDFTFQQKVRERWEMEAAALFSWLRTRKLPRCCNLAETTEKCHLNLNLTGNGHFSPTWPQIAVVFNLKDFLGPIWVKGSLKPDSASLVSLLQTFCCLSPNFLISYPLRSWWVPGCEGVWWKQTPAPRCPPSAAPPSPRWRSASLPPPSTLHHHIPTRTRSPIRPPRPQDQEQDQRSHPHLHSSSPAPTPALRRPTSTGQGTSSTHLLICHFLNPVWVRRVGEVRSKKLTSGLSLNVIKICFKK